MTPPQVANKLKFMRGPLNLIDFFTIVPFLMETVLFLMGKNVEQLKQLTG
jgi:hypothetical protein